VVRWNELNLSGGFQLPLNLSQGRQYRALTLSTTYNYNYVTWKGAAKTFLLNSGIHYLQNRLVYVGQGQQGVKQIYPSSAQVLTLQYRSSIDGRTAHQFLGSGTFYLPGLMKTHSLVIDAALQVRDTANQYFYTNDFPVTRGYKEIDYPRMYKLGFNYHFPLFYPEWGFGNLVYFRGCG